MIVRKVLALLFKYIESILLKIGTKRGEGKRAGRTGAGHSL
jgi:hypothetical protein